MATVVEGEEAPSKSEVSLERLAQLPAQDQLPGGKWQDSRHLPPAHSPLCFAPNYFYIWGC